MAACRCGREAVAPDRRRFLGWAALGGAALLVGGGRAWGAAKAPYLLLNCIDYRLAAATTHYMAGRGLERQYDQIVLAGASIGIATDREPAWATTFWQHVDIARKLHGIQHLVILEHRDCGAYAVLLGEDFAKNPAAETRIHAQMAGKLAALMKQRHPELTTEAFLMNLHGKVERLPSA